MEQEIKCVPLNIVMTYPVHWSKYQVIRDFVQNFYDSVGYREWNQRFKYKYVDNILTMWVNDVSFSYEWLMHIGASTKTANSDEYAGYFGEGFKIASLCAYRDMGWSIEMFSDEWHLRVSSCQKTIDGMNVEMLSYDIMNQEKTCETKLIIKNMVYRDYQLFLSVLNSFYYPENPIMGELIWSDREGAVYLRSKNEIDANLPITSEFGKKGAVFCGYQMLGTNPFGLVVCLHSYKKNDRERRGLYSFEIIKVFESVCHYVDSKCAAVMLVKLRKYWNSYPHGRIDIHSWSYVVNSLIRKVSISDECKNEFVRKNSNLLCLDIVRTVSDRNRRDQARAWLSQQANKYILVKGTFALLGYKTLEDECEENGGFVIDEYANELQEKCFNVLEDLCKIIFDGFFIVDSWPERKIIANIKASYHGMAIVNKKKKVIYNNKGLGIRYDVGEIYLKEYIFSKEYFYDALSTYVHELCHMFGGDSSSVFSQALTYATGIIIENHIIILKGKECWIDLFDKVNSN